MCKILVTGGAGFIASELAKKLSDKPENFVVIVDNLLTGNIKKVPSSSHKNIKFIKADVNNYKEIAEIMFSYKFDYVFHYAAVVGVIRTLQHPISVLEDIEGIKNILNLSKNTGVKRIYYSSSSEVYGEPVELPQNENTTPLNSRLPYAIVKNVGEAFMRSYFQEYGLEYTIFRFFNTYGSKQSKNFVISKFMISALKNEDISIYGDGMQTRTFCYIDDNIDACLNSFYNNLYVNDVVNIGSSDEITILDLARKIIDVTNSNSKIIFCPPLEEGDMTRRQPDVSKMDQLLLKPTLKLEDGLKKILKDGLFELTI
ncbi:MAG TPA: epimerase [Bacteroidales bacterium]|nr:MAG: epimerase [Bacteroidetes bacterium GWF2_33_38]OFY76293.1 MAG: epimerase [Bacteroidetes bacterium RIFOXYA12_FULL_33_9]HBF88060.1 epimerase [Bacteroidales bacterium]